MKRLASAISSDALRRPRRQGNCQLGLWVSTLWVSTQRVRKGRLSAEQQTRLNSLGFVWGTLDAAWEAMFTKLKRYKLEQGDCNVPSQFPKIPN